MTKSYGSDGFPLKCGLVHTYPDIFDNGDFFHRFRKNTRPHVAYSNRFRPSTRKRLDNENTTAPLKGHALYQEWYSYRIELGSLRFRPIKPAFSKICFFGARYAVYVRRGPETKRLTKLWQSQRLLFTLFTSCFNNERWKLVSLRVFTVTFGALALLKCA